MKPEEATDIIESAKQFYKPKIVSEAFETAISALKEIQQYREIGTVEELKTAMEYWKYLRERRFGLDNVIEKCVEYEQIGTVEEFREAVELLTNEEVERYKRLKERDTAKAPIDADEDYGFFTCPSCGEAIYASDDFESHKFCLNCGQRIQWRE